MTHEQFQEWLDRYVEAWKSYDPQKIGALFSEGVEYRYHPQDDPVIGREAIVKDWLENPDAAGTYDAKYEVLAIDGDTHVANGWSRYFETPGGNMRDEYLNIYVCRFNSAGECTSFTEYWIQNRAMRRRSIEEMIRKAGEEPGAADEAAA
jgi:SnoaL-like domain